jgi:predicted transcriptional regulator
MYQANLSYKVLQKYLAEVVDSSLISFEDARNCYHLTDKGKRFLEAYEEYSRSYKHVEKRLNDVEIRRKNLQELCPGGMS